MVAFILKVILQVSQGRSPFIVVSATCALLYIRTLISVNKCSGRSECILGPELHFLHHTFVIHRIFTIKNSDRSLTAKHGQVLVRTSATEFWENYIGRKHNIFNGTDHESHFPHTCTIPGAVCYTMSQNCAQSNFLASTPPLFTLKMDVFTKLGAGLCVFDYRYVRTTTCASMLRSANGGACKGSEAQGL